MGATLRAGNCDIINDLTMRRYLANFSVGNSEQIKKYQVIIVGSGVAGLTSALWLSRHFSVALITKSILGESASRYAQGGVAAATSLEDSPQKHLKDTLAAGGHTNKFSAAELLVNVGPSMIRQLESMGLSFDTAAGKINFAMEGGHSIPRVLHVADDTGAMIQSVLVAKIKESQVDIYENCFAVDLLTDSSGCRGLLAVDKDGQKVFLSDKTVIATGGAGRIFSITTNPQLCTGDGMAMAYRAGCMLGDMEFIQFHPTAIKGHTGPKSLITEALRGEGAHIIDSNGIRFIKGKDERAELAPRDVIVRSMAELITQKRDVYLDARHLGGEFLRKRFPTVYGNLQGFGYDISNDIIPVEPSAHYFMGGLATDLSGRTPLKGLYACGEAACSGVHGSNRLASNSLLEGLVFANQVYKDIEASPEKEREFTIEDITADVGSTAAKASSDRIGIIKLAIQKSMTKNLNYIRSKDSITESIELLNKVSLELKYAFDTPEEFELANIITIAKTVCASALAREESRGAHFRSDIPGKDRFWEIRHIFLRDGTLLKMSWEELDTMLRESWK